MPTQNYTTMDRVGLDKNFEPPQPAPQNDVEAALQRAREARNSKKRAEWAKVTQEFQKGVQADRQQWAQNTEVDAQQPLNADETPPGNQPPMDEPGDEPDVVEATAEQPDQLDLRQDPAQPDPLDHKVTKLVNGQRITRTVLEWTDIAANSEAELAKQEATRRNQEQEAARQQTLKNALAASQLTDEEAAEIARVVQEGDQAALATALKGIHGKAVQHAVNVIQQQSVMDNYRNVFNEVQAQNPDIVKDPELLAMANAIDAQLHRSNTIFDTHNDLNNFRLRYAEAFNRVRAKVKGLKQRGANKVREDQLRERKEKLEGLGRGASATVPAADQSPKTWNNVNDYSDHVARYIYEKRKRQGRA